MFVTAELILSLIWATAIYKLVVVSEELLDEVERRNCK
jgi:hypothetical protein